jgi:hypothetical protein
MKKPIFLVMLIGAAIFSSCDDGSTNSGNAPVLRDVFIAGDYSELSGNTERTSFRVGDQVWVRFTVIDEDLDADKILITQKNGSLTVGPFPMILEAQNEVTQYYIGYMDVELAGEWVITAYCLDKKGNKSDTITKNVTVTE